MVGTKEFAFFSVDGWARPISRFHIVATICKSSIFFHCVNLITYVTFHFRRKEGFNLLFLGKVPDGISRRRQGRWKAWEVKRCVSLPLVERLSTVQHQTTTAAASRKSGNERMKEGKSSSTNDPVGLTAALSLSAIIGVVAGVGIANIDSKQSLFLAWW